jgi:hypothetical protein
MNLSIIITNYESVIIGINSIKNESRKESPLARDPLSRDPGRRRSADIAPTGAALTLPERAPTLDQSGRPVAYQWTKENVRERVRKIKWPQRSRRSVRLAESTGKA